MTSGGALYMGSRNEYGHSVSTATAAWQCRSTIINVERHTAKSQLLPDGRGIEWTRVMAFPTEQAFRFSRPQRQRQEAVVRGIACTGALMANSWTRSLSTLSLCQSLECTRHAKHVHIGRPI